MIIMYNQNTQNTLRLRCCDNCKRSFSAFKQVVNLKKSGLTVYIYEDELQQRNRDDTSNRCSIILYNSGDKELKRYDYIIELCRYRTKCFRCTALIQRVRSLLDNITSIKKYQILGLCDYCKRTNMINKCKRCEHIVNKFITNKVQECKDHEEIFTTWFYKVQRLLMSITQGKLFCKHSIWFDYDLKTELNNLLQHLKSSLPVKQPFIEIYPDRICLQSSENKILKSKLILDDLILKLKSHSKIGINIEQSFNNSATDSDSSYCICKYLNKNETKSTLTPLFETLSVTDLSESEPQSLSINCSSENYKTSDLKDKNPSKLPLIEEKKKNRDKIEVVVKKQKNDTTGDLSNINLTKQRGSSLKKKEKVNIQGKYLVEDLVDREIPMEKQNKVAKQETNGSKINVKERQDSFLSSRQLMLNLIKERDKKNNDKEINKKQELFIKIPVIADFPFLNDEVKTKVVKEDEASTIECSQTLEPEVSEFIKGNKIVPYHGSHYKDDKKETPLLFQILVNCTTPTVESKQSITEDKTKSEMDSRAKAGLIFYKLSDRKFIENGWTKLPTTKIMKRVNHYKMIPYNDESDWFKCNSERKILFYDSGEKLAEVYENGCGKWFYENGDIALEYYKATGITSGKRFIIYSSSEESLKNKKKSNTILGCFDSLGNGVIYDYCGNIRLKYNQSEGLVVDKKIGPPGRWIWHTLNEPPVLQHVFFDTKVDVDPCLQGYVKDTLTIKEPNEEMILIELNNLMRERSTKVLQKYKPFEIRMKVFKINDYFSLRIIDQSKIYVKFQCGRKCFKHNFGMVLKSDEIVDTELVDFGDVSTPYDRKVPQSESLENIQNILSKSGRIKH